MGFEVYQDAAGGWRWRFRVQNGKLVADSGEAYSSHSNATRAIEEFKKQVEQASAPDESAAQGGTGG